MSRAFGIHWIGLSRENLHKLLVSLALIIAVVLVSALIRTLVRRTLRGERATRVGFWSQQTVQLATVVVIIGGVVSIWFDSAARLTSVLGLVTAGVAIALQRVITSFAAYLIILRGRVFTVGDRITMASVRGDVIALGFMQTTIMEMGESPAEQAAPPAMWVQARQYTGRIVRITNDRIFDSPVYNFTHQFPFIWEEMHLPVSFKDDRARAEQILLEAARKHTRPIIERATPAVKELRSQFPLKSSTDLEPRVYWRITDNWLELSLRFIADETGVRALKDAMSRDIMAALDEAKIGIASGTYEIVGLPPVKVELADGRPSAR